MNQSVLWRANYYSSLGYPQTVEEVQAPRGVAVFQVAADNLDSNITQNLLSVTVDHVRKVGRLQVTH